MIYSSACEYAIRAVAHLALRAPGEFVRAGDLSELAAVPAPFLSTVLQRLAAAELLRSARGPGGGYTLARPPEQITLFDIVRAIDGVADLQGCVLGLRTCSDAMECPVHETWKPIREQIRTYLTDTTVDGLADALTARGQG